MMDMTLSITDVLALLAGFVSVFSLALSYKALTQAMEARADAVGVQRSTHTIVPGVTLDKKLAGAREGLEKKVEKLLNPSNEEFDWLNGFEDEDDEGRKKEEKPFFKGGKVNG